nr:MAG TPA: minor tail protein [Caudoviricetes sp.]
MSINVGQAIGYLDLDISGFQRGFKSALQDLRAFNDSSATVTTKLGALGSASKDVGSSMTKNLTVPITGAGAAVVGVAAKFESAMSEVAAISGASGDELQALTDKAQEMGATTKFSASESAAALKYMAMAGWDTEAMLNGINGVMQLAAASGEDLASTSDIVTDAMTAFGLSADQSTRFADVLAQTANRSNTSVALMGETFKYVAPVAGALGYSIEDASVAIGLMANSGIKGSQAGTSLKNVLTNLAKPTDQVQSYMDKLNISLTDSAGNVKSLNQLLNDMRNGFNGLTEAEKAEYAAGIAGKEGMSGLLAIVNSSQADFDNLTEAINNSSGAAQNVADVMMDNLGGQLTILKSTLEGIAISFGNILLPAVKKVVSSLQNFLNWLNGLTDGQKRLVVTIATVVAAIGPVLLITGKLITSVANIIKVVNLLKPAFAALNAVMAANPIAIVVLAVAGLIAALVTLYNKNKKFRDFVNTAWTQIKGVIGGVVDALVNFFTVTIPGAIDSVIAWFQTLVDNVSNFFTVVIPEKINALVQWFTELPERIGYAIGFAIGTLANWVVSLAEKAAEIGPKVIDSIVNFFSQLPGKVWNFLVQTVTNFANWIVQTKEKALTVGAQIIDTVVNFFLQLPGKIWSALTNAISRVRQWGTDLINWAKTEIPKIITQIVDKFLELPSKLKEIGTNLIKGLWEGISGAGSWLKNKITGFANGVISGFKNAFGIHSPSTVMATQGGFLMAGLSKGMENGEQGVIATILEIFNSITSKLDSLIGSIQAMFSFGGSDAQEALTSYNSTLLSTITLYSKLNKQILSCVQSAQALVTAGSSLANRFVVPEVSGMLNSLSRTTAQFVQTSPQATASNQQNNTLVAFMEDILSTLKNMDCEKSSQRTPVNIVVRARNRDIGTVAIDDINELGRVTGKTIIDL